MTMARQPARRVTPSAAASVPWPETSPIMTAIVPSSRSTASKKSPPNSSRCSPGENATSTRRSSAWMAGGGTSARRISRCSRALPSPARRASSIALPERRRCSSATEPAIHVSPIQSRASGMPNANGSGGSAYPTRTTKSTEPIAATATPTSRRSSAMRIGMPMPTTPVTPRKRSAWRRAGPAPGRARRRRRRSAGRRPRNVRVARVSGGRTSRVCAHPGLLSRCPAAGMRGSSARSACWCDAALTARQPACSPLRPRCALRASHAVSRVSARANRSPSGSRSSRRSTGPAAPAMITAAVGASRVGSSVRRSASTVAQSRKLASLMSTTKRR